MTFRRILAPLTLLRLLAGWASMPFSSRPSQATSVTFWADLKPSTDGAWIALLDAAELKFNSRS